MNFLKTIAVQKLASFIQDSNLILITGSIGKTTTLISCQQVLAEKFLTTSLQGGLANLPLKLPSKQEKILLEVPLAKLEEFNSQNKKPQTIILTKLAPTSEIADMELVLNKVSKQIFAMPGATIISTFEDVSLRKVFLQLEVSPIFYGLNPDCHVWAGNIRTSGKSTVFELNFGVERVQVNLNNLGRNGLEASLAAAALGISLGISLLVIKKALEKVPVLEHRLQILEGIAGSIILDDSFEASIAGVEDALEVLNTTLARKRIVVLGELKGLGELSEKIHRQIAQKIYKERAADYVILGGGETRFIQEELSSLGFPGKVESDLTHSQIVSRILTIAGNGDIILVKGAKSSRMDEVVKRISKSK